MASRTDRKSPSMDLIVKSLLLFPLRFPVPAADTLLVAPHGRSVNMTSYSAVPISHGNSQQKQSSSFSQHCSTTWAVYQIFLEKKTIFQRGERFTDGSCFKGFREKNIWEKSQILRHSFVEIMLPKEDFIQMPFLYIVFKHPISPSL